MSALARFFNMLGKAVAGYDKTPSRLSQSLEEEGISVHYEDQVDLIPAEFKEPGSTLIVYTPAIPSDHQEWNFFRKNNFVIYKRAQVLGFLTQEKKTIAVAGTHGKTTISTMIAYILKNTTIRCSAFLGGISKNFNSNLMLSKSSEFVVTEADEFDRSFLNLFPYIAVITAIDADHLDIYKNKKDIEGSFNLFAGQIKKKGYLIYKSGLPVEVPEHINEAYTYSLRGKSDFYAENIRIDGVNHHFNVVTPFGTINDLSLGSPGITNVENAVAAVAVASILKIHPETIKYSLNNFRGVVRRFDFHLKTEKVVYVDDYAHHPKEIEAFVNSIKEIYQTRKITGIFQPHLFSRTRDFIDEFAESLGLLDEIILLDIYPARENPIPGVTSELLFDKIKLKSKTYCEKKDLMNILSDRKFDVLLTMGAGDIDKFIEPITTMLKKRFKITEETT